MPEPMHQRISLRLKDLTTNELDELQAAFDTITHFLNIEADDAEPIVAAQVASE
jgi:hypothetical protein